MLAHPQVTKLWLYFVFVISLMACFQAYDAPVAAQGFPPAELIKGNITSTDVTVILEIEAVRIIETLGHYSNWEVEARVVKSLKGSLTRSESIQYHRMVEDHSLTLPIGSRHLVSFILKQDRFVIPDVGYHFPYSSKLKQQLNAIVP